jgi:signal transduction histidine kinase
MVQESVTGRHPNPRWAWIAFWTGLTMWTAVLVAVALVQPGTQGNWGSDSFVANLPFGLMVLTFDIVGVLIATRRPDNPIGWMLLAIGLSWSFGDVLGGIGGFGIEHGWGGGAVVEAFNQMTWVPPIALSAVFLILVFPDGHLPSPRWRWFVRVISAGLVLGSVAIVVSPGSFADSGYPHVANPLGIEALQNVLPIFYVLLLLIPVGMIGAAIGLVQRYRRSRGAERAQMKWLAFAAGAVAGVYAIVMPLSIADNTTHPPTWLGVLQNVSIYAFALIPIAIGFAVLKYRLYEIDVVINKTVVFGSLALFIGVVYVTMVVGLGQLIGTTTNDPVLSIAATAVVALLFEPVRARVQRLANRLVYGERATPYEVLMHFSERIAGTYATEDVLPRTARVIAEGTGAERVDIWLRAGDALRPGARWPADAPALTAAPSLDAHGSLSLPGADKVVPVRHRDQLLGAVTVAKPRGDPLTPGEADLLDDLAEQAGLVLSNVRLTADLEERLAEISSRAGELRASRQRIVTTQDAERRRLERNIHDGAQQHLVALAVKLRLARALVGSDPAKGAAMLGELRGQVEAAIETLSSLALGIYPPVLEERGIGAALESQARLGTVPVRVQGDGVDRQPIETEAAVYFCCLEAIQNATKHAGASRVDVTLGHRDGHLTFEIRDDGGGFDAAATPRGSGLQGMADRLAAVGGSVEIDSSPGHGTVVTGRVPAVVFA